MLRVIFIPSGNEKGMKKRKKEGEKKLFWEMTPPNKNLRGKKWDFLEKNPKENATFCREVIFWKNEISLSGGKNL